MATYTAGVGPNISDTDRILIDQSSGSVGSYQSRSFADLAQAASEFSTLPGGIRGLVPMVPSAAYASSTTIADVATLTIPANTLKVGSIFKVHARGKFSNTSTPNLTLGLYWGGVAGTALAVTGATATITSATNWPFELNATVYVSAIGAAGAMIAEGHVLLPASLTAFQAMYPIDKSAIASVASLPTNVDEVLSVGATWGSNSASNTLTVVEAFVQALNF